MTISYGAISALDNILFVSKGNFADYQTRIIAESLLHCSESKEDRNLDHSATKTNICVVLWDFDK